jgi:hypothetical protein
MDEEIKLKFAEMQAVIDALKAHIENVESGVCGYITQHREEHRLVNRQAFRAYAETHPDLDQALLAGKSTAEYFKDLDAARE